MGQATSGHTVGVARTHIRINSSGSDARQQLGILTAANSDKHARPAATETVRSEAGVLQRFPGDFQQESLLGIERNCFTRRNAEELRVEKIDLVEEAAAARENFSDGGGIGIVVGFNIP